MYAWNWSNDRGMPKIDVTFRSVLALTRTKTSTLCRGCWARTRTISPLFVELSLIYIAICTFDTKYLSRKVIHYTKLVPSHSHLAIGLAQRCQQGVLIFPDTWTPSVGETKARIFGDVAPNASSNGILDPALAAGGLLKRSVHLLVCRWPGAAHGSAAIWLHYCACDAKRRIKISSLLEQA